MINQIVVMTGSKDPKVKKFIEDNGGKVTGDISGKTTLLLYAAAESGSRKYEKAKAKGIEMMSIEDFITKHNIQ